MVVQHVVAVLMLVITCIAIWYSQMRVSQGKIPTIRRLPAMDALEEAIALCAEIHRELQGILLP